MACYAAIVSLVQLLKEITRPDYPFLNSIIDKQQIHVSLYEKFNLLQELLDDYSPKDLQEKSTDILQRRITNAAYHVQDIIESYISYQILPKDTKIPAEDKLRRVKGIFRHFNLKRAYRKLQPQRFKGPKLDNISEKEYYQEYLEKAQSEVDSIVEKLKGIKESRPTQEEDFQINLCVSAEAQSGRNTMVGFEEQLIAVKDKLCGQSSKRKVLSIVGMGGIGKTTLARKLFDDEYIVYHFHCRAWVTVSQDYHMKKVLLNIGNSINIMNEELSREGEQVLKEHIRKHLIGMRYLIIIDDMWDVKVWDELKMIFPDKSNGSRIMITTRVSDVAVYAGSSKFFHQMQFLNKNQSWILLQQKVFGQEHCPEELEAIGKLIAENCRGLPLGIVVIAGVLSNVNKVLHDWEEIARHVSSVAIDQNDKHLSNILSLSYNHLPYHLKPCFLYLGGFPEDHDIRISQLIRFWVAEGLLRPIESKSLEEVGEEYLKDLANRNLIFFNKKKFNGKFEYCSIYDLMRDLCSQRAQYENFLHCLQQDDVYHKSIGNVHRVFASENSLFLKYTTKQYSTIRTAISFSKDQNFLPATANCKLLRILEASHFSKDFYDLPFSIDDILANEIFELLHLRYLTLDTESDIHISPSICKLWNLQTLIVKGISVSLPWEIWTMTQLRHLILKGRIYGVGVRIPPIPYGEISIIDGVPLLGSLQTLQGVYDFIFTSHTIEMIPSLKKLAVYYCKAYESWEEVGLNNLVHLHQLEKLKICFSSVRPKIPLPENFAFPPSLTQLTLEGCELPWKDMSVVGSLPNLQVLKLRWNAFVGEEWKSIEGEFLKLKSLLLRGIELKYWRVENIHFPCLEQLHIESCYNLEEIPSEIGDIPTLQFIGVRECNSDVYSSASKIQEEQRDQGNDDLHVCVPEHPNFTLNPCYPTLVAFLASSINPPASDSSSI